MPTSWLNLITKRFGTRGAGLRVQYPVLFGRRSRLGHREGLKIRFARTWQEFAGPKLVRLIVGVFVLQALGTLATPQAAQAVASCTNSQFTVTSKHNPTFYYDSNSSLYGNYTSYLVTNKGAAANYWVQIDDFSGGVLSLGNYGDSITALGSLGTNGEATVFWYLKTSGASAAAQNYFLRFYNADPSGGGVMPICEIQSGFSGGAVKTIAAAANKLTSVSYSSFNGNVSDTFTATVKGQTGTIGAGPTGDYDVNLVPSSNPNFDAKRFRLTSTSYKCDAPGSPAAVIDNLFIKNGCSGNYTAVFTYLYTSLASTNPAAVSAISPLLEVASGANMKHTSTPSFSISAIGSPAVSTYNATSVTNNSATLNGAITAGTMDGGLYFCKQTGGPAPTPNFVLPCADTVTAVAGGAGYVANLNSLAGGTTYYFELIGISAGSPYKGGVKSFVTLAAGAYDTTTAASSITPTSAILNGQSTGLLNAAITSYYFLISTEDPSPDHLDPSTDDTVTAIIDISGAPYLYAGNTTGLNSGTKYYYELVVVDNNGGQYLGGVLSFTTPAIIGSPPPPVYVPRPPTITSISASEVCAVSSQLTVNGTNLNGATATVDGQNARVLGSSQNQMIIALPNLSPGVKEIKVTNVDGSAVTTVKYTFINRPNYINYIYPEMFKDRAFTYTFKATDAANYAISGALPGGLTLNPSTGELSGTPTVDGTYFFSIVASNICASAPLNVYMFIDKAIPDAFTCSVAFNVPSSDSISDIKIANLKNCLDKINRLGPTTIDPVIFISGGIPFGLSPDEALAHPRYSQILDLIDSMKINAQIYVGAFSGSTNSVQLNVYWPNS